MLFKLSLKILSCFLIINKKLSYGGETGLDGRVVWAESGRLELGDDILRTL